MEKAVKRLEKEQKKEEKKLAKKEKAAISEDGPAPRSRGLGRLFGALRRNHGGGSKDQLGATAPDSGAGATGATADAIDDTHETGSKLNSSEPSPQHFAQAHFDGDAPPTTTQVGSNVKPTSSSDIDTHHTGAEDSTKPKSFAK